MMTWAQFPFFAVAAAVLWVGGAATAWLGGCRVRLSLGLTGAGLLVMSAFIAAFWWGLGRPPLRTLGETRLWYAFFVVLAGWAVYARWHYRWLPSYAALMASVFLAMNVWRPEIHDQTLMPALQSYWFVPHVCVYMLAYALLGCAFLLAVADWAGRPWRYLPAADRLVYVGTAFLTLGMLSGALWAKEAWGHYWSWDPKETWAAVTWCLYVGYVHWRLFSPQRGRVVACVLLVAAFLCLQMCWYGVNYLPAAQGSMHVYANM